MNWVCVNGLTMNGLDDWFKELAIGILIKSRSQQPWKHEKLERDQ